MLVAEAVGRTLAGLGVDTVFGVVGSGNFHVTNALVAAGTRCVAARHECGAATMADAYARTSRKVGALSLHQGCGLTNAMTGITEAAKSRTPMLVLAADTAAAAVRSNFRVDQDALALAVGAVPERIHAPQTAVADAARAWRTAVAQRRTVVLNLPLDVQAAPLPEGASAVPPPLDLRAPQPSPASAAALAEALRRASRPVFIAGRGARVARARASLERLADTSGALLATSAVAKGMFNGNPWYLDVSGGFASPLAAELIRGADLIVGWGCALNMWTMRHGALIGPGATCPSRTPAAAGASTRARSRSRWTTCCRTSGWWRSTPATSWATRACTCPCRMTTASASRRRSSRSGWAWRPRSARRWPARGACRWPRWATAARS